MIQNAMLVSRIIGDIVGVIFVVLMFKNNQILKKEIDMLKEQQAALQEVDNDVSSLDELVKEMRKCKVREY